jgi:elongator complex protein 3
MGREMIKEAERIARKYSDGIDVIAGAGVREYFRKLGYKQSGTYMNKEFKKL